MHVYMLHVVVVRASCHVDMSCQMHACALEHLLERGAAMVGVGEGEEDLEVGEGAKVGRQRQPLPRALLWQLIPQVPTACSPRPWPRR